MLEIIGVVSVLLVNVCAVVLSTTTEVSIARVADPLVDPPLNPVPATTAVISPSVAV